MNPTMMRMIVKVEQDEKIRRAQKHRILDRWQARNHSGSLKTLVYNLAALGVIALFVVWTIIAI